MCGARALLVVVEQWEGEQEHPGPRSHRFLLRLPRFVLRLRQLIE